MLQVLLIALSFLAYIAYAGAGLGWLALPVRLRPRWPILTPLFGAALVVVAAHWAAVAGLTTGWGIVAVLAAATAFNAAALIVVRRAGLAVTLRSLWDAAARLRGAVLAALAAAVFVVAVSPLVAGPRADGASIIGHNGDAITHVLLAESLGMTGSPHDVFAKNPQWLAYGGYPFRPMKGYLVGGLALVDHARYLAGVPHYRAYSIVSAVLLALALLSACLLCAPGTGRRFWIAAPVFLAVNVLFYLPMYEDYLPQICAAMILPGAAVMLAAAARDRTAPSVAGAAVLSLGLLLTNPGGAAVLCAFIAAYLAYTALDGGGREAAKAAAAALVVALFSVALNPPAAVGALGGAGARASIAIKAEEGAIGERYAVPVDAFFAFFGLDRCPPSPFFEVRTEMLGKTCGHVAPAMAAYRGFATPGLALALALLLVGVVAAHRRREWTLAAYAGATAALLAVAATVDAYTLFKAYCYALIPAAALIALGLEACADAAAKRRAWLVTAVYAAALFLLTLQFIPAANFMHRYRTGGVLLDRAFMEKVAHLQEQAGAAGTTIVVRGALIDKWWYQYFLRDAKVAWWLDGDRCRHVRMRSLHKKECDEELFKEAMQHADFIFLDREQGWKLDRVRRPTKGPDR